MTNFVQQDCSGARTSTSSHTCCHQSHYPGHYITASSYCNNYLVHSSGKTSHFKNYCYNYRSNIVHFGEIVVGDIRNIPTQKLPLRNQHQKLRGIWLGRDLITNEHILALLLQYSQHPSTTTGAYRCRQITSVPREEQRDVKFLESIYWPQLSDDIDFNTQRALQQPPETEHRNKRSTAATTSG